MRKALSLILIAVFLVSFFGGLSVVPSAKAVAQEVTYNLGTEPPSIDPAIITSIMEFNIIVQVFDGLTRIDNKNTPQPAIAKSWTISKDRKTYIFTLRDAYWTNGTPVTAYDFEYAWKRALSPDLASQYAYQLYYVYGGEAFNASIKVGSKYYAQTVDAKGNLLTKKVGGKDVPVANMAKEIDPSKNVGVKALNAKMLKVYLQSPTAYFLSLTAFPTLMPVCKAVVSTNDKWAADVTNYVTDGPFTLTQWSHEDKLVFVKNPTYWDKDKVKLTKITYLMVEDSTTALSMYQSGQLDAAATVPTSELPKLVASGDAKILPYLGTYFYLVNVTKKPFNDVRVRKALLLAINRKGITQSITKGGEIPALGFVPYGLADALPGSDFRKASQETFYKDNDIVTAKALLAQAGYPNGKGFPAFTLQYNTSDLHKTIAEAIQGMWKKNLGITCTLEGKERGVYLDDQRQLNYDVERYGWIADYMDPMTFLDMWVTGGGNNNTGWSNKSYDALIAKAKATVDPKARMATLHAAEKILMTDFPILPIYYYTSPVLLSKHIKNFYQSALGSVDWKNAYMG
ncbi:peptide ABC transporter substrate-binding protein [Candidatus Cryosericum septentrionale]|jgi:oligopeptide transport system substrate-binding protein|uniref:Peptide ABC transporter substrate-binding protein n=1 Tax=Candidatus Cryosericum septentrionale TaxID=2290913 RepID=A0A398DWA0_9BACT|nr:peptide ABC transporter substrate-binding protein [Candidatus Cryosericum septentrionale]RIE15574.1 peptide ABC transporter substrate-binding protein [Candidatus Cryosericum septentrionale]